VEQLTGDADERIGNLVLGIAGRCWRRDSYWYGGHLSISRICYTF